MWHNGGGVSVGSVINCMHCVMVTLLGQHNEFIQMPGVDSEDTELVHVCGEKDLSRLAEWHLCSRWFRHPIISEAGVFWRDIL